MNQKISSLRRNCVWVTKITEKFSIFFYKFNFSESTRLFFPQHSTRKAFSSSLSNFSIRKQNQIYSTSFCHVLPIVFLWELQIYVSFSSSILQHITKEFNINFHWIRKSTKLNTCGLSWPKKQREKNE